MQESAWQGGGRDGQLPRMDTGACSAAAGTASAASALGGEEDVLWRKKRMIREEASMRNKRSVHGRTEAKQSSFHWYSPSTQEATKKLGGRGWWCLSVTNPLGEKNQIDVLPRENRSPPPAPEEFDRGRAK